MYLYKSTYELSRNGNVHQHYLNNLRICKLLNGDTINIDISYLVAPKPCGSNYIDVKQNTQEWHDCRKFKITARRLA